MDYQVWQKFREINFCNNPFFFRSTCFNQRSTEIAVVSKNGYIHCWDATKFKQIMTKKLPHAQDNVCLAINDEFTTYAVGSKTNTDLIDARTLQVRP